MPDQQTAKSERKTTSGGRRQPRRAARDRGRAVTTNIGTMTLAQFIDAFSSDAEAREALDVSAAHLRELRARRKNPSFEMTWKILHWTGFRVGIDKLVPIGWGKRPPRALAIA